MEFFKNWLAKNSEVNRKAKNRLENQTDTDGNNESEAGPSRAGPSRATGPIAGTSRQTGSDQQPGPSRAGPSRATGPIAGTSRQTGGDQQPTTAVPKSPSDLVYEDDDMKLIVQKGFHQHQKIFKLQVCSLAKLERLI